ncbi:MAG TPA: arginine--tRNA ligase [Acidimicrobiales bacterium]|nr:arginine--tRNA ligase [Acidimicrobiales bacterium]
MSVTRAVIEQRLRHAFDALEPGADPVLRASDHADFQANGALALAKRLGRNPREVAEEVCRTAALDDVCRSVEVSGPGFVNLTLADSFVATQLDAMASDERLSVPAADDPQTVVVDYSAPNVAKEMHVGHLRSTIIGDALVRTLEYMGHRVVKENHVGDWGTPFGMLIEHLLDLGEEKAVEELSVGDLDTFYRQARASFDADPAFQERSRRRVVALQSGDEETLRLWRVLVAQSVRYFDEVYTKLDVLLTDEDIVGESFYNPMLAETVAQLDRQGLLVESEGALCVFPPGFTNRNGDPLPLIVQKSDEGYGYATTDLAAIRDRVGRIGAQRILYVVGAPQAQHFGMCFATARLAGWLPADDTAVHVAFGSVLGADRKMFRTRAGDTVKLGDLLDEAVARADAAIAERDPQLEAGARAPVARAVGIGAVKFADLSTDRVKDYVFDWDRMLAFEGFTGPYLQYAYARIRSIFRRAGDLDADRWPHAPFPLGEQAERDLALALLAFPDALDAVLEGFAPSRLCAYLYDVASAFATFFENCPVLQAPGDELRQGRLRLADLTGRVLAQGLALVGITAPERM